ncbi:Mediator of RNA polymerase II transcription subunit 20 (Mediator complex subunit 20) [Mucor velutinosus]|uniref:Mediator of RNA polymerase II transcription subunit 20 (Mediator complex subunit 20) n=1 Tax=Mucor velutinosus TaxID=708070 RepID=A0AAN7I557_9FUNG|nr:Mediator of RNA polymerase II transcription subunit 20 (Mediator complex subunit 20) [Mucor velutinosus]
MPKIIPSLLIAGDMNYCFDTNTYHHSHRAGKPKQFMDFLNTHFSDCLNPRNEPHAYTFKRGSTMSTLDYMFAGQYIASDMSDATNWFLRPEWTDHALVTKTYITGLTNCGKGIWRANPHLAKNPRYRQKLADEIERFVATKLDYNLSAQDKWDLIKRKTKQVTVNFAGHHDTWRKARIKALQSERNNLLRRYRNDIECLKLLLPDVEGELPKLQQEIVEIQMLKAGRRWLEQSEKSPGYIKHTIDQRVDQRTVAMLKHPSTGEACLDMETKLNATESFYQDLYTEEPIDYDDILDGARRTPKQGSPGLDGIGYEIFYLLVSHPSCRDIIHQVFNDAVLLAKFPKAWQASCIIILHKKGDKSDLANYRPITLIAADCKVFTRIMNSRVVQVANRIITPYRCGFLPGRYIGDHGMSLQVIMANAQSASWWNPSNFTAYAGIMLDNAKAYDRVHPKYLSQVLLKFGFPEAFVTCITNLFFDNSIYVNVNGFLTGVISQRRGVRQGDSISPVLFNLVIESFLLSIINNMNLTGYSLKHVKLPHQIQNPWISPAPIKVLAYADNVLSFVKSQAKLVELQDRLRVYNQASNAKVNYSKSFAFPLHGSAMKSTDGQQIKQYVTTQLQMKCTGDPDFQPFVDSLIYQLQQILKLANRDLRFVMLDMANLDVGRNFSNHLSKQQWQTFYKNNMHYSARNLWYRMIHKQSSNKLAMSQLHLKHAESDRCELCYEVEDAKHFLISCVHKLDVWDSSFNEFLGYPKSADSHLIYKSVILFKLDRYFIYNLDIHITIFDLFATIMRIIWRNHYQQLYNHMPFDSIQTSRQIRTEVLRLSNLK